MPGGRGVASPAGKPGKPPGEAPNNQLRRSVIFPVILPVILIVWSVIYAPSWSASIRLGRVCRFTKNSTGAGGSAGGATRRPPCVESVITGGRHLRRPDSMETYRIRPPVFAWQEGVASPAGKPPGKAPNNHLCPSVTFAGHFVRNTVLMHGLFNILSVIYAPSWSASIWLGHVCRSTTHSTGGGRWAAPPAEQPNFLPALSPSGGRHPRRPDSMETMHISGGGGTI